MEYLDGQTLKDCIQVQAPLPLDPTRFILRQVLEGLGAIHLAGAVHRDLKPANIMLIQDGSVKILDLGISRVTGTTSFTRTGATLGTPQFISPEQVMDAKRVDHRADLFCVGLMAYQMMSGHLPYEAPRLNLMMHRIATGNQTPLREHRPDLPQPVLEWVELLTRHNPNERFMSASEAMMMLEFL
jgi:serine/threonine-protein kinase